MDEYISKAAAGPHLRLLGLGRNAKKMIMVLADLVVLPLALWSGYALRLSDWWPASYLQEAWMLFVSVPFVGVFIFMRLGLYRAVVRFMGAQAILAVCKGVFTLALLLWGCAMLIDVKPFPRSVPIIFALAALVYVGGSRLLIRNYYHWLLRHYVEKEPVLIYGAGGSGIQLATALHGGAEFLPVGYLDDNKELWNSTVNGLPVHPPTALQKLIDDQAISYVLLALPSISRSKRRDILESLVDYSVHVKTIPNMCDLISGEAVDNLREVELEDLLGRDAVPPNEILISRCIAGKNVFVSGAGGSIGSEICRQVIQNKPRSLVLYEISEFALYSIEKELCEAMQTSGLNIPVFPVLGSVCDEKRVNRLLGHFDIETIYHAAAYKHVPMVEHNIIEGVRNNVFGTKVLAEAAHRKGVDHFVLISTDKAVRPTNVMGATKRLAELVLQNMASVESSTTFSMVRFGNVLGSSGSVVPLFRQQIIDGGPLTVTHPEITRFFMTIPEAASLVIQAGSMAEGSDVFVLDMGQSVKIVELAHRLIKLMGLEVKSSLNPNGIEIAFSGLRPGEKLYEELLIGDKVVGTEHPKILRAQEESIDPLVLQEALKVLNHAIELDDGVKARSTLQKVIAGFEPSSPVVDWLLKDTEHKGKHTPVH
ncbi:polysaccharide biosynthesis protein [Neptuniibacter sp. QD72_48]|uniref:polysaccharide biosynthesis protein n=1 Tax=unclassified Neptuniibacter TaxID=2630693 RepID=UPI0039F583E7